jgi:ferric-dicitrate binding protein FerR (iron transport regulator)
MAATLAVAAGLGVWQSRPVIVQAPLGEQLAVALPDGSTAELNAGSSLQYARGFRRLVGMAAGARTVALNGEAYFSVVRSGRPFTVITDNARVIVLGTSFVVRAHRSEPEGTLVGVESGRVRVEATSSVGEGVVELVAGQETLVRRDSRMAPVAGPVDIERLTLWRSGGLALVNLPLDAIFRELERRYAVDIRLRGVAVGEERLAVYYPERPSIESVLNDLCTIRGLRFTRTSRGFDISPQTESADTAP